MVQGLGFKGPAREVEHVRGDHQREAARQVARGVAPVQGLTLVHYSAQRKHILWDTLGASFSPSLLDRGTRRGVTNTAEVELKSGRV